MNLPACPDPAHAGSRVVRDGWYGRPPQRRQRFRCYPPGGDDPHRFTPLLTHLPAADDHCAECSSELAPWQGQAGARHYQHDARSIAQALTRLGDGATYSEVGRHLRARRLRRRLQPWEAGDHLAASWVDVFAPIAYAPDLPQQWPEVVVVDGASFPGPPGWGGWHILGAAGCQGAGEPAIPWALTPTPFLNQHAWANFFRQIPGNPRIVIGDMEAGIWTAVRQVWPQAEIYWCEFHLRRSLEEGLAGLPALHPLRGVLLDRCFYSLNDWDLFARSLERAWRNNHPVGRVVRFLRVREPQIRHQIQNRQGGDPRSNGAAEAMMRDVNRAIPRSRAIKMGNLHRTTHLLGLILAKQRGMADEVRWADRLRRYLEQHDGTMPIHQKENNDPAGQASLRN